MDSLHFTHFTSLTSQPESKGSTRTEGVGAQFFGVHSGACGATGGLAAEADVSENFKILLKNFLWESDTFTRNFQKFVLEVRILIFVRSTLQLVRNIKPRRKLFCTDSSFCDLGLYLSYNILKFHPIQRTFLDSLTHSLHSLHN